jgi:hypothetical protein
MLIIPEIETVLILVPRTGSSSLRRAVQDKYPQAMQIYRHMEADGIPRGYDRWRVVGIVRHPLDRLWSLYKFLQKFGGDQHDPEFVSAMKRCVEKPFDEWIVENETVFTSPYDRAGFGRYYPQFTVNHALPENRKSQFVYLRPDLGTEVFRFEEISKLALALRIDLGRENRTSDAEPPQLSVAARDHIKREFAWDLAAAQSNAVAA